MKLYTIIVYTDRAGLEEAGRYNGCNEQQKNFIIKNLLDSGITFAIL